MNSIDLLQGQRLLSHKKDKTFPLKRDSLQGSAFCINLQICRVTSFRKKDIEPLMNESIRCSCLFLQSGRHFHDRL